MKISRRRLGLPLFVVGFLLLLTLNFNLLTAAQEANLFDADYRGEAKLETLRCPRLMSRDEIVPVRVTVDNPTDAPLMQFLRLNVSRGNMLSMQEYTERIEIPAGGSFVQEWPVGADDPVYGRFVLLRAHALLNRAYHYRQAACGIVVLPFSGISGELVLWLVTGLGILAMALGGLLWGARRPLSERERKASGILVLIAALNGVVWLLAMQGIWLFGWLLLLFTGLALLIGMGQVFLTEAHSNH